MTNLNVQQDNQQNEQQLNISDTQQQTVLFVWERKSIGR